MIEEQYINSERKKKMGGKKEEANYVVPFIANHSNEKKKTN